MVLVLLSEGLKCSWRQPTALKKCCESATHNARRVSSVELVGCLTERCYLCTDIVYTPVEEPTPKL